MFKGMSVYAFRREFQSEEDCKLYLFNLKWSSGYCCRKCANTKSYVGRTKWNKKCSNCYYDESVTANTLFHKMKIPVLKAFEIFFTISLRKKGMSSQEIAKTYEVNKDTAWLLRKRAQLAMFSSGNNKLKGKVFVDEFSVGGKEKGKQGRSSSSKKVKVILGCEVVKYKGKTTLGNAYAQVIGNYSTEEILPFFEQKIELGAKIKTDKWRSYIPLTKKFNITQEISEGGVNFKELNTLIMLFKGWLRGIHHHVSKNMMQQYINEFFFKFNRKAFIGISFSKFLERMMNQKPWYLLEGELNG
jgi:transposase-like protein